MDECDVLPKLRHWMATGDEGALADVLAWLEASVPIPKSIARALGAFDAEALRTEAFEQLLRWPEPPLLAARSPLALARAAVKNRWRSALRARAGRPEEVIASESHTAPAPDPVLGIDDVRRFESILRELAALRRDERVALLLLHAPDRLREEDWRLVADRHPPPPPQRPGDVCDLTTIAALLFPDQAATSAYDRVNKMVQRAYVKLQRALGAAGLDDEETP